MKKKSTKKFDARDLQIYALDSKTKMKFQESGIRKKKSPLERLPSGINFFLNTVKYEKEIDKNGNIQKQKTVYDMYSPSETKQKEEYVSWIVKMKNQKFENVPVEEVEALMEYTVKKRNSIHNMENLKKIQYEVPKDKLYNEIM